MIINTFTLNKDELFYENISSQSEVDNKCLCDLLKRKVFSDISSEKNVDFDVVIIGVINEKNNCIISFFHTQSKFKNTVCDWNIGALKICLTALTANFVSIPSSYFGSFSDCVSTVFYKEFTRRTLIDKRLSKREKQIYDLIQKDYSNQLISQELFISEHTVKTHRHNICKKLNIKEIRMSSTWTGDLNLMSYN